MFAFIKSLFKHNVVGRLEGCSQELHVDMVVLKHVSKYRQTTSRSTEAGGQLFGAFDNEKICVVEATGPYIGDYRSRSSYRSNPVAAQRAIEERSLRGLLYLGEWHTHAEDHPVAFQGKDATDDQKRAIGDVIPPGANARHDKE